jgi:hypothetical protein
MLKLRSIKYFQNAKLSFCKSVVYGQYHTLPIEKRGNGREEEREEWRRVEEEVVEESGGGEWRDAERRGSGCCLS